MTCSSGEDTPHFLWLWESHRAKPRKLAQLSALGFTMLLPVCVLSPPSPPWRSETWLCLVMLFRFCCPWPEQLGYGVHASPFRGFWQKWNRTFPEDRITLRLSSSGWGKALGPSVRCSSSSANPSFSTFRFYLQNATTATKMTVYLKEMLSRSRPCVDRIHLWPPRQCHEAGFIFIFLLLMMKPRLLKLSFF